jgi:hypothetical protein
MPHRHRHLHGAKQRLLLPRPDHQDTMVLLTVDQAAHTVARRTVDQAAHTGARRTVDQVDLRTVVRPGLRTVDLVDLRMEALLLDINGASPSFI